MTEGSLYGILMNTMAVFVRYYLEVSKKEIKIKINNTLISDKLSMGQTGIFKKNDLTVALLSMDLKTSMAFL